MYIPRIIDLKKILEKKSCFLFGPRQTGKSFFLRQEFSQCKIYNLLDSNTFRKLSANPSAIRQEWLGNSRNNLEIIVIDEVQKLPVLLDEVHLMIEEYGLRFVLTGSSARSLRRKGVNLLAGRARNRFLHPFVRKELGERFDFNKALNIGLLPTIYFSDSPWEDLSSYVGSYLKEEIAAEGLTRNVPAFSRFLEVAALCNGEILNYSQIASDAEVKRSTVVDYFQILRDTLIGYDLPSFGHTKKRKAIRKSKFYFFDSGVVKFLTKVKNVELGAPLFGKYFEHYLFHELRTYCDLHVDLSLCYWRSTSQFEVDFIIGEKYAFEVKAKIKVSTRDIKGVLALKEEGLLKGYFVIALVDNIAQVNGVTILPWDVFLTRLYNGDYLD